MNCMYFKFLFHKDDPDHICGPSCNHNHSDNSPEFEVISSHTKQKIIPSKSNSVDDQNPLEMVNSRLGTANNSRLGTAADQNEEYEHVH